jgi:hypothetical protein
LEYPHNTRPWKIRRAVFVTYMPSDPLPVKLKKNSPPPGIGPRVWKSGIHFLVVNETGEIILAELSLALRHRVDPGPSSSRSAGSPVLQFPASFPSAALIRPSPAKIYLPIRDRARAASSPSRRMRRRELIQWLSLVLRRHGCQPFPNWES